MIPVEIACRVCGRVNRFSVYLEDIISFQQGTLIQDAFPYLTSGQRELFLSQICDSCFEDLEEEDEC